MCPLKHLNGSLSAEQNLLGRYARINYSNYERDVRFTFPANRAVVYMQYLASLLYPSVISAVWKVLEQCIMRILNIYERTRHLPDAKFEKLNSTM